MGVVVMVAMAAVLPEILVVIFEAIMEGRRK